MTPEQRIVQLEALVADLMAWKNARAQQITQPLDDISRMNLRVYTDGGFGSSPVTQSITISSTPTTITVPAVPDGSLLLEGQNGRFGVPYFNV